MYPSARRRTLIGMSSAPRPTGATTVQVLRRHPQQLRAVVALGLFSVAEHAAWVTFLVFAYERGGVREAGIVSASLLVPAALLAPLVAKEVSALRLRHPLSVGYGVQCIALALTACVAATDPEPTLFYMAAVLVTVTTVFSRPAHHGAIAGHDDETMVAANVATGFVSGLAQLVGPLMASAVLLRFGVVEVVAIGAALLAAATTLTVGIGILPPTDSSNTADTPALAALAALSVNGPADGSAAWPPRRPALREVVLMTPERRAVRCVVVLFCLLGLTTMVLGVVETLATEVGWATVGDGGAGTGALIAAAGAGLLVGATVAGVVMRRSSERLTMRIGAAVTGVALLGCAADRGMVVAIAAFALVGVGMQMILVAGWVLLHHHVEPAATCMVFGLLESQQLVGNAAGAATAGVAIAHFGVWAVVASSAAMVSMSMLVMTAPRVRILTAPPAAIAPSARRAA